jgi:hypothetical protein
MNDDIHPSTIVLCIIGVVTLLVLGGFGIHACSVADQATIGRAEQKVQTQNFEESQAYREGLRRDFDELMLSYSRAKSDDERATILAVMRHRAEGAPPDLVPANVKNMLAHPPTGGSH